MTFFTSDNSQIQVSAFSFFEGGVGRTYTISLVPPFQVRGGSMSTTNTFQPANTETFSYVWEYNTRVGPFTAHAGAILAIYDPPASMAVTTRYRRTLVRSLYGVICETRPMKVANVTVRATVTPGSIDADQSDSLGGDPAVYFSSGCCIFIGAISGQLDGYCEERASSPNPGTTAPGQFEFTNHPENCRA